MASTKTLKIKLPKDCIGCELCVYEVQRQLGKVGIEGALIRILRKKNADTQKLEYYVELDPRINTLDIEKIMSICPKNVFEIIEGGNQNETSL